MKDIECEHCGGTEFYKEAGFFFCSGCQTQSQDVQEYAYDEYAAVGDQTIKQASRKLDTSKTSKSDNRITSWECYNYILLGLTEELINLGANKRLKPVMRILWLRYLEKLEVFQRGKNVMPKLQGINSKRDADIIYGRNKPKKKRKRKSGSSDGETTSLDTSSVKRERSKRKKALIKSQYDQYSQKSQTTPSIHTETLTSLQTGSEKSSVDGAPVVYNKHISKELSKRGLRHSYYHWREHRLDFDQEMTCHKVNYRSVSGKYKASAYILSINKLYALLHLGLLIIRDKIQLSDMLRFIREGRLSFNYYTHLFPEDFIDKALNFRNFKKYSYFANYPFRVTTYKISALLKIEPYISSPDFMELSERYCRELNLPSAFCACVKKVILSSNMSMRYKKHSQVPNHEGRVLSVILFLLKLLFGFDDSTEFHLAEFTRVLNTTCNTPVFFNIEQWLKHIEYRELVMRRYSPVNDYTHSLLALSKRQYDQGAKIHKRKDNFEQLLSRLKDVLPDDDAIDFPVTLTPYLSHLQCVPKLDLLEIIEDDFHTHSLSNILNPAQFLNVLKPEIVHGGACESWSWEKVLCGLHESTKSVKKRRKLVTVALTLTDEAPLQAENTPEASDGRVLRENFDVLNKGQFERSSKRLQKIPEDGFDLDNIKDFDGYIKHYNPYERFWLRTRIRVNKLSQEQCGRFLGEFPRSFRLVFSECARIAQQNEQEFLEEYQFTELMLAYHVLHKPQDRPPVKEALIKSFLKKNEPLW